MDAKLTRTFHNHYVDGLRKKLNNYDLDKSQSKRKEECKCKYCTYIDIGNIVMDAFTSSKCKNCGKELTFANSDTDDYCLECAKKNNICKHCGSEMD